MASANPVDEVVRDLVGGMDRILQMAERAYSAAERASTFAQRQALEHVGMKASDLLASLQILVRDRG
jgi:hypothetical protein